MKTGVLMTMMCLVATSCLNNGRRLAIISDEPQASEQRRLRDFEKIEVTGSPTVYYTQADTFSVRVKGPERFIKDIVTEVEGHTLKIRNRGKVGIINITPDYDDAAVYVSSPDLTGVAVTGSGDFISRERVDTDKMSIRLRGSGDIDFKDIICDHCDTELTGSGDIDIDRLESRSSAILLVGSGDIEMKQWNVLKTDISLRGSGDICVDFVEGCQTAACSVLGSGDVSLKGKVGHYKGQKRGSGEIDIQKLYIEK